VFKEIEFSWFNCFQNPLNGFRGIIKFQKTGGKFIAGVFNYWNRVLSLAGLKLWYDGAG
jgi:hypothetical protein